MELEDTEVFSEINQFRRIDLQLRYQLIRRNPAQPRQFDHRLQPFHSHSLKLQDQVLQFPALFPRQSSVESFLGQLVVSPLLIFGYSPIDLEKKLGLLFRKSLSFLFLKWNEL
jgi:hypothetical protein